MMISTTGQAGSSGSVFYISTSTASSGYVTQTSVYYPNPREVYDALMALLDPAKDFTRSEIYDILKTAREMITLDAGVNLMLSQLEGPKPVKMDDTILGEMFIWEDN
jgi:hypothetical protein